MWHNAGLRFFRPNREADDPNYSPKHMHILLRVFKSVSVTKDSQDTLWPSPGPTAGYHLKAVQSPQLQMTRWIDGHLRNSRCLSTKNVDVIQESTKNKSLTTKVTYSWITWPYYIYIRQDSFLCKPFLRIQDPNKTTTGKKRHGPSMHRFFLPVNPAVPNGLEMSEMPRHLCRILVGVSCHC